MKRTFLAVVLAGGLLGCAPTTYEHPIRMTYVQLTGHSWVVGSFKNGKKVGHWIYYDKDGHKIREGDYFKGDPDGTWTFYRPDGSTFRIDYFLGHRLTRFARLDR